MDKRRKALEVLKSNSKNLIVKNDMTRVLENEFSILEDTIEKLKTACAELTEYIDLNCNKTDR